MKIKFNHLPPRKRVIPPFDIQPLPQRVDNMSRKIALVTTYCYDHLEDDNLKQFFRLCLKTQYEHARSHNYTHIILNNEIKRYPNPAWYRFEIYDILTNYDAVLYVDADIYITSFAPSPIDYYSLDSVIALDSAKVYLYMKNISRRYSREYKVLCGIEGEKDEFKHYDMNNPVYINSGVMIVPKEYKHLFKPPTQYINHRSLYEQTLINTRLNAMNIPFTHLDHRWNTGHIHNSRNMKYAVDNSYYLHFNIGKNISRYDVFQNMKELYKTCNYKEYQRIVKLCKKI